MQDFMKRVITEKKDLDKKLDDLRIFISSSYFHSLTINEQDRLKSQEMAMYTYSDILVDRIAHF